MTRLPDEPTDERHADDPALDRQDADGDLPAPPTTIFDRVGSGRLLLIALSCLMLYQMLTQILWPSSTGGSSAWMLGLAPIAGVVVPLLFLARRAQMSIWQGLGLRPLGLRQLAGTLLSVLGTVPIAYAAGAWSAELYPPWPEYNAVFERLMPHDAPTFAAGLWAVVIAVPLGEELIFRHLVLGVFFRNMPVAVAIVLGGILFGAAHMAPWLVLPISILGIVLGALTYWTRSITAAWLGHACFNLFAFIELTLTGSPETAHIEDASLHPAGLLLGAALLAAGLSLVRQQSYVPRDGTE